MSKPSVLFINRVYPPARGATGRVLSELAESLAREGWAVTVLTTGDKTEQTGANGVIIRRVRAPSSKHIFSYMVVWAVLFFAAIRQARRDVVITLTDPPMQILIGRFYAWAKGAHHIHWCHDLYPDLFPALGYKLPGMVMRMLNRLSRRSLKSCDRVVVIGQCMAKHLAYTGMDMTRVKVIPNWTDREIVHPDGLPPVRVRMDIQGAKSTAALIRDTAPKFRILYAGSIARAHPMQAVLDAAQILSVHSEIEFLFVGDSPAHERFARERDRRGLTNIKFIPYQPVALLRGLMESGDVHLVTQKPETAGMLVPSKMYAAMTTGRPCLYAGPADTESAKMICDYKAGMVLSPADGKALAEAILLYRMNPDVWEESHFGAVKAASVFYPAASLRTWAKLTQDVVDRRIS